MGGSVDGVSSSHSHSPPVLGKDWVAAAVVSPRPPSPSDHAVCGSPSRAGIAWDHSPANSSRQQ